MKTKEQLIDELLENHTYLPESGVIKNLREALLKLSRVQLSNLALIVGMKMEAWHQSCTRS